MERLMQYLWQYRLIGPRARTVDGEEVSVIDPGLINRDAGPDFFNAKIQLGDRLWCGNVEIHVKASDWYRHGHDQDQGYDSIVLHVVAEDDMRVRRADGTLMPQMVMNFRKDFSESYKALVYRGDGLLPCADVIRSLEKVYVSDLLTNMAFERIGMKADDIKSLATQLHGDWRQTIYVVLAQALGFHINSQPFRRLAVATPLDCLLSHRDSRVSVEGLLFGQAGFLDNISPKYLEKENYVALMLREYQFLAHKYRLKRPEGLQWKMARMRPANFPHRRIATLAAMICADFDIAQRVFAVRTIEDAFSLFDIKLDGFWAGRYNFASSPARSSVAFSRSSIVILTANVTVPLLYAFGMLTGDSGCQSRAMDILQQTPPEVNSVTAVFKNAGMCCGSAFDSQAMIQLCRNYCEPRKCIYCRIGHRLLRKQTLPSR